MSEPIIEINNLTSGYGQTRVIHDLSMTVKEGSLCAIVGPNGHGKTTLMKSISGLVRIFSGSITFSAEEITRERVD